tara:strand:+ start:133 stop:828 length:696 start_codon:yes stop_codon:yes gene_type:complete
MKNLLLLFLFTTSFVFSQEYYWTSYSFNVSPEDVETVANLTDDYFSQEDSKKEGVSVYLFENHFSDSSNNASHSLVFAGTLNAMGEQYSPGENVNFQLFLTKIGQHIEDYSSASGRSLISFGAPGTHPVQNVYWFNVKNPSEYAESFKNYHGKFNPENRRVTLGAFSLGRSPHGETHYVLVGVDSFKEAFNLGKIREEDRAASAAWDKHMSNTRGIREIVRTHTRVMLGKW